MRTRLPTTRDVHKWAAEFAAALERGTMEARTWLATPQGRRLRTLAAQAIVLTAPVALRHPFFKTPAGRLVGAAGGTALLLKLAELLRDWEPELRTPPA